MFIEDTGIILAIIVLLYVLVLLWKAIHLRSKQKVIKESASLLNIIATSRSANPIQFAIGIFLIIGLIVLLLRLGR